MANGQGDAAGGVDLRGHSAILDELERLGVPTTRRTLHRWMTQFPEKVRFPARHVFEGNRAVIVIRRERLVAWAIRMDDLGFFRRVKAIDRRRRRETPPTDAPA